MNDYCGILSEIKRESLLSKKKSENLNSFLKHVSSLKILLKSISTVFLQPTSKLNFTEPFDKLSESCPKITSYLNNTLTNIDNEIIIPCDEFAKNNTILHDDCIKELQSISTRLIQSHQHLEKSKNSYQMTARKAWELESKIKKTTSQINMAELDTLAKLKSNMVNSEQMYRYEIEKMNKLLQENSNKYTATKLKLKAGSDTFIAFSKEMLLKYFNVTSNISKIFGMMTNAVSEVVNGLVIDNLNFYQNSQNNPQKVETRFPSVNFLPFDSNIPNVESNDDFEIISNKEVMDIKFEYYNETEDEEVNTGKAQSIFVLLNKAEEITSPEMTNIMSFFNVNNSSTNISVKHIEHFMKFIIAKKDTVIIKNNENFFHFCNVINAIAVNINSNNMIGDEFATIIEMLIKVGEKTMSVNRKYMCDVISRKNNVFVTQSFWMKVIREKIIKQLNEYATKHLDCYVEETTIVSGATISKGKKLFSKIKNVFKKDKPHNRSVSSSLIHSNGIGENMSDDDNADGKIYQLEYNGYVNGIKGYERLSNEKKALLDSHAQIIVEKELRDFILHMCNYSVLPKDIENIVNDLHEKFQLQNLKYYISLLNFYKYSRKTSLNVIAPSLIFSNNEKMTIILANTATFLPPQSRLALLVLNKGISQSLKPKMIQSFLKKLNPQNNFTSRMKKWCSLINEPLIKNLPQFSYETLKFLDFSTLLTKKTLNAIDLDVERTSFFNNEASNRQKITFVLRCLAHLFPSLGYCQGMSYTTSFILQLVDENEEKVLSFMIALVKNSEYFWLYEDDLLMLKKFFFFIDNIITIFYPRIAEMLIKSHSLSNFFAPPWFLTLFTNISVMFTKENLPLCVIAIWDRFLVDGYKAILLAGVAIINYERNKIESFDPVDCFEFMVNKLIKSDCFKNENFEVFMKHYDLIYHKINWDVLNSLEIIFQYENEEKKDNI